MRAAKKQWSRRRRAYTLSIAEHQRFTQLGFDVLNTLTLQLDSKQKKLAEGSNTT